MPLCCLDSDASERLMAMGFSTMTCQRSGQKHVGAVERVGRGDPDGVDIRHRMRSMEV